VRRDIRIGSVSWLNGIPTPLWFAGRGEPLEPAWVVRTYVLLKGTSNPAPPAVVADFDQLRAERHFRALTWCRCAADLDDATGELKDFRVLEAWHDPGWTPPFRYAEFPPAQMPGLFADPDLRDPAWYPGEASGLSQVCSRARHKNSAVPELPAGEQVLVNALVKFRAGGQADGRAVRLGCPFHVPWLWQEWLLSYGGGRFKLYLRASRFPSHAWYCDGRQVTVSAGLGDASFPRVAGAPEAAVTVGGVRIPLPQPKRPDRIDVSRLALYPAVLSQGAPAADSQVPNGPEEEGRYGPVDKHPCTVAGWGTNVVTL
jgi:hypothetical protein